MNSMRLDSFSQSQSQSQADGGVHGEQQTQALAAVIQDHGAQFSVWIESYAKLLHPMGTSRDGLQVESVTYLHGNVYELAYSFAWTAQYACSDTDVAAVKKDSISFCVGDDGVFDIQFPMFDDRSTGDEL